MLIFKFLSIPIAVMSLHGFAIADTLKTSQANDGTYHVETVPSQEACGQLCNNDTENVCRGYVFYQSDASVAQGECRLNNGCLLYTSPSPRDRQKSRMPSSA